MKMNYAAANEHVPCTERKTIKERISANYHRLPTPTSHYGTVPSFGGYEKAEFFSTVTKTVCLSITARE